MPQSAIVAVKVCLPPGLSVCLSVYVCMSVWLPACLPACQPVCLSVYLSVCLSVCLIPSNVLSPVLRPLITLDDLLQFGVSGSFWYSTAAAINITLFPLLSFQFKTRAPGAKTYLQVGFLLVRNHRYTSVTFTTAVNITLFTHVDQDASDVCHTRCPYCSASHLYHRIDQHVLSAATCIKLNSTSR